MRDPEDDVGECLRKVEQDLRAARGLITLSPEHAANVCFHAQQAAEKVLKAFLVSRGVRPPRIHDLGSLLETCSKLGADVDRFSEHAERLTGWAWASRYPYGMDPDEADARSALATAEDLVATVRGLLP